MIYLGHVSLTIPIHDFRQDTADSVPFRYLPLDAGSPYDIGHPHRHNYYEIFFFRQGGGVHTIDYREIPIHAGAIHFISPGQVHLLQREADAEGGILLFSREFYYSGKGTVTDLFSFPFLHNMSAEPVIQTEPETFSTFYGLLEQIRAGKGTEPQDVLRAYLNLVLLKCNHLFVPDKPVLPREQELFLQFRRLVEEQYREHRQPSHYAAALFITEKKLNQITRLHAGMNAGDYIRTRILLEAKRLLHNADHQVKEIGYFLGFEDPAYFNRFFKANTGITAMEFRNMQEER
ncbi:MAG: helix-turn-helix domain-containing protein [Sphingobacteriales bacterium]|nr:MAG: helix-turn-helix domain-containing protein [Sphingobacteriales bacterium]